MEGYGLYWYCLELIARNVEPQNLSFELEHDAEIIASRTGIHYEMVQEMMSYMVDLGLFDRDAGYISCLKMKKWCDEYISKAIRTLPDVRINSGQTPEKVPPNRTEQNRIEQNRKRGAKRAPHGYQPSSELLTALSAETGFTTPALNEMLREMKDHEFANAKRDWDAVFRNWVRRQKRYQQNETRQSGDFDSIHANVRRKAGLD